MGKKGKNSGSRQSGERSNQKGNTGNAWWNWVIVASAIAVVAAGIQRVLRWHGDRNSSAEYLPPEPPVRPELLMDSMQRVKEQRPISLDDVSHQIRFFCSEELEPLVAGASSLGGPSTSQTPITPNCGIFAKSLSQVSKALELTDVSSVSHELDDATHAQMVRLDKRLTQLMRFQVDFDAIQSVVLRLAEPSWDVAEPGTVLEGGEVWPSSLVPLIAAHLLHGDDQLRWERRLVRLRRRWMLPSGRPGSASLALAAAVACQATLSDHAWHESAEEEDAVSRLEGQLKAASPQPMDRDAQELLAMLGAYRALLPVVEGWSTLEQWRQAFAAEQRRIAGTPAKQSAIGKQWPFWQLWRLAVENPLVERGLREKFGAAHTATSVSGAVRAMYEHNPYPKWSWMHPPMEWPPQLFDWLKAKNWKQPPKWPQKSLERPRVLIAGCGTGHWLTHFARHYHASADIWAMDLSLSSLSFAARKAAENGLTAVHFVQGDILAIPEQIRNQGPFDFIEVGGVLHHLREPLEGWKRLAELLRPGGVMLVALYSKIARSRSVDPCRDFARAGTYNAANTNSLRRYRYDVHGQVDLGVEWAAQIVTSKDFASLNAVRDLCLHIQETQYTLLEISEMLETLGLQWLQMAETVHEDKQERFRKQFGVEPFAPEATLKKWHQFELLYPTTFLGMYEFFVQRHH